MIPLRRFARREPGPALERCELCSAPLGERHRHLVDLSARSFCCACRACALLFENAAAANGRFRTIPERVLRDFDFSPSEEQWAALQIPVELAFFFLHGGLERWIAFYPSPAGAVESELPMDAFRELFSNSALIEVIEPDVEALLVRTGRTRECLLVPIDECYRLISVIRRTWRGFDGGLEVKEQVDACFERLRERSVSA
jgi:hypothetical protein